MSKHTPGPWEAKLNPYNDNASEVYARNGCLVVAVCGTGDEAMENARLIAAAPDLLEALHELQVRASHINNLQHAGIKIGPAAWSDLYESCNKAKAAIAKAEQQ